MDNELDIRVTCADDFTEFSNRASKDVIIRKMTSSKLGLSNLRSRRGGSVVHVASNLSNASENSKLHQSANSAAKKSDKGQ